MSTKNKTIVVGEQVSWAKDGKQTSKKLEIPKKDFPKFFLAHELMHIEMNALAKKRKK